MILPPTPPLVNARRSFQTCVSRLRGGGEAAADGLHPEEGRGAEGRGDGLGVSRN